MREQNMTTETQEKKQILDLDSEFSQWMLGQDRALKMSDIFKGGFQCSLKLQRKSLAEATEGAIKHHKRLKTRYKMMCDKYFTYKALLEALRAENVLLRKRLEKL